MVAGVLRGVRVASRGNLPLRCTIDNRGVIGVAIRRFSSQKGEKSSMKQLAGQVLETGVICAGVLAVNVSGFMFMLEDEECSSGSSDLDVNYRVIGR